jgi:hypothetical protein
MNVVEIEIHCYVCGCHLDDTHTLCMNTTYDDNDIRVAYVCSNACRQQFKTYGKSFKN